MTIVILIAMVIGAIFGRFVFPDTIISNIDTIANISLYVLIFLTR